MFEKLLQNPMGFLTGDPLGQTVLAPFAVALLVAALLRVAGGGEIGRRTAAFGIGAGFLAAYFLIAGLPATIAADTPAGKLFWIAAAGVALGFVLDLGGAAQAGRGLAFAVAAAAIIWLVGARHEELWRTGLLLFAASILLYWRIGAESSDEPERGSEALFPPILLLVAAVALTRLIPAGAAANVAALATALAAAAGGYLLLTYAIHLFGGKPPRFAASGTYGGAGALLAIVYVLALFLEGASPIAGGILLLAFLLDHRARALALSAVPGSGGLARALQPVVYAVIVAMPAAAAVAYVVYVEARPG